MGVFSTTNFKDLTLGHWTHRPPFQAYGARILRVFMWYSHRPLSSATSSPPSKSSSLGSTPGSRHFSAPAGTSTGYGRRCCRRPSPVDLCPARVRLHDQEG